MRFCSVRLFAVWGLRRIRFFGLCLVFVAGLWAGGIGSVVTAASTITAATARSVGTSSCGAGGRVGISIVCFCGR